MRSSLLVFAILFLNGCGWGSKPPQDPKTVIKESVELAKKASEDKDAGAAKTALTSAEKALAELKTSAAAAKTPEEKTAADGAIKEAEATVLKTKEWAELAKEESECASLLNGVRARSYRATRKTVYEGILEGWALACDEAAKHPPGEVPQALRDPAWFGYKLTQRLSAQKLPEDHPPDYAVAARDLRALKANPTPELSLVLAVGFTLTGHNKLALFEFEGFAPKNDDLVISMFRLLMFRSNGWNRMADRELEALQSAGLKSEKMEQRKELEAVFYLLGALHYLREKDYAQVDRYLSMALRASPTHPFTIYLTGERLAADGKTEAAAESMEKLASTLPAGPEKALYESLTKRAREIRDSKGTPPKFLDDPAVVWALIRLGLQDLAKRVPETKPVIDKLEAAQQLADEMKGKLGM